MASDPVDPLQMAENCAAAVLAIARYQDSDPLGAYLAPAGSQGKFVAELAGQMALVSIARDLRRLAEHFTGETR